MGDMLVTPAVYTGKYITHTRSLVAVRYSYTLRQESGRCPAICSSENLRTNIRR